MNSQSFEIIRQLGRTAGRWGVVILTSLLLAQAAGATLYYVAFPDDASFGNPATNTGTLRWCIEQANANPGYDTIRFLHIPIIMIVPLTPYQITDSVAIHSSSILIAPDGPGGPGAFSGSSIFEIGNGKDPVDVQMWNFNLLGFADPTAPRAIDVRSQASLSLYNAEVSEFDAARLGAVLIRSGAFATIKGSSFYDNAMVHGGAVMVDGGAVNVVSSRFERNRSSQQGGAIYSRTAEVTLVSGSELVDNTAGARGGAMHVRGPLDLRSSTFDNNYAGIAGGALYLAPASHENARVDSSIFTANKALVGGALGREGDGSLELYDSDFFENFASHGGALYLQGGYSSLVGNDIQRNGAEDDGGGLWFDGDGLELVQSLLAYNQMGIIGAGKGGGAFIQAGTVTFENSTLSSNGQSGGFTLGGNLAIDQNGSLELRHVTLALGEAALGGGIWTEVGSNVDFFSTIVADSVAGADCSLSGGGGDLSSMASDKSCKLSGSDSENGIALLLQPLANYGGPTDTHVPDLASPAVDRADPGSCPHEDQRDEPRPAGDGCDVGAVEVQY